MTMNETQALSPLQQELREAMTGWGCPLCKIAARTERVYLDSLNYERILDLNTRDALKAARGLCPSHSRAWRALQGSALGIAIVYRVAVLDLLRATEPEAQQGGFLRREPGPGQIAEALEPTGPCPACALVEETVQRFADLLMKDLHGDADLQAGLTACGGLCLPHLRFALARPRAGRSYKALLAVQREAWTALMAELDEFIRKNDYRFRHEPMGEERDAWLRALDVIVGLDRRPPSS